MSITTSWAACDSPRISASACNRATSNLLTLTSSVELTASACFASQSSSICPLADLPLAAIFRIDVQELCLGLGRHVGAHTSTHIHNQTEILLACILELTVSLRNDPSTSVLSFTSIFLSSNLCPVKYNKLIIVVVVKCSFNDPGTT